MLENKIFGIFLKKKRKKLNTKLYKRAFLKIFQHFYHL